MSAMLRKRRRAVKMSPVAMGQGTKSLRDSPLKRGPIRGRSTKGEIIDSGHVCLS
jgi:hypothetical protein